MSAIITRLTGRIWFVYFENGHRRLYFDRPDRTEGDFFSLPSLTMTQARVLVFLGSVLIGAASGLIFNGDLWPSVAFILAACFGWTWLIDRVTP